MFYVINVLGLLSKLLSRKYKIEIYTSNNVIIFMITNNLQFIMIHRI